MADLNSEQLNEYRRQGYRPVAVGCFVNENRVLLAYKAKHRLWQFPQGGIENQEEPKQALIREMSEELGMDIAPTVKEIIFLGENAVDFQGSTYRQRDLQTDQGEKVFMKGKHYFIFAIKTKVTEFNTQGSDFDQYLWADYDQAKKLFESIYQPGKRKIALFGLELLKAKRLIK